GLGFRTARRASSPLVAMRPSRRNATAFTAPSWKRSTCSAAFFCSDQRIAEVSKLPEIACVPSGEIASARTGPPWPRSCACANGTDRSTRATATRNRNIDTSRPDKSGIRGAHPERTDFLAHIWVAQGRKKRLHRGTLRALLHQQEIVVLRRHRQESEVVEPGDRLDGDAPVGAALRHRGGDRIVRARLVAVA